MPAQTAVKVDGSLDLAALALIGCAVMTGVGAVLNTARVRAGDSVVVVGCGGVGLSVVQGRENRRRHDDRGRRPGRGEGDLARKLGATHAIDPGDGDVSAALREIVPAGADYSFEALGRPETIETAIGLVGKGGTAVLVGMAPPSARIPIDALTMTIEERSIKGCWYGSCRPSTDFARLVDLYRGGVLDLESMVSARCSLGEVNDAFSAMERGEVARTVIDYGL